MKGWSQAFFASLVSTSVFAIFSGTSIGQTLCDVGVNAVIAYEPRCRAIAIPIRIAYDMLLILVLHRTLEDLVHFVVVQLWGDVFCVACTQALIVY